MCPPWGKYLKVILKNKKNSSPTLAAVAISQPGTAFMKHLLLDYYYEGDIRKRDCRTAVYSPLNGVLPLFNFYFKDWGLSYIVFHQWSLSLRSSLKAGTESLLTKSFSLFLHF